MDATVEIKVDRSFRCHYSLRGWASLLFPRPDLCFFITIKDCGNFDGRVNAAASVVNLGEWIEWKD